MLHPLWHYVYDGDDDEYENHNEATSMNHSELLPNPFYLIKTECTDSINKATHSAVNFQFHGKTISFRTQYFT